MVMEDGGGGYFLVMADLTTLSPYDKVV